MSSFQVDVAHVDATATAVAACATRVRAEVDAMMRHLTSLQGTWRGQAASSFQELGERWRHTQGRVQADLDEIQRALVATGRRYADAEAEAARLFAG